jgi:DNA modification methylase/transcriptional regulator with XRE-family HTH domain
MGQGQPAQSNSPEEMDAWGIDENGCAPDCPIRILGEQSGERKSDYARRTKGGSTSFFGGATMPPMENLGYNDTGTAARYFAQFYPHDEPAQERETMSTQLNQVLHGDCLEVLSTLEENSVDSICCDPPAGIGFMGKEFDSNRGGRDLWVAWLTSIMREALRVLKPGAHAFVWALPRTSHWTALALEDAGFEIRDSLAHMFGCLSEDTEILTANGWEQYHKCVAGNLALCYNVNNKTLGYEPIQEVLTYDYDDTAYRIHSDSTDQLVSRNHRCIVERDGREVFQYAETLQQQESVPVLEDLSGLLKALPLPHERTSSEKQEVFRLLAQADEHNEQGQREEARSSMSGMRKAIQTKEPCITEQNKVLFRQMLRGMESGKFRDTGTYEVDCQQRQTGLDRAEYGFLSSEHEWCEQSSLEGRRNRLQEARQLYGSALCEMPTDVHSNGAQGWVRDGTSSSGSTSHRTPVTEDRGGTSYQSRSDRQPDREPTTLCEQSGSQTARASRYTRSDLATVTPAHYQGVVWCVRVPSGAFVARRNGKVFITGNSGFPKSANISAMIDKRGGKNIGWFGPWLREERARRGITQKELAQHFPSKTGGMTGCVANWELGLNTPTVDQFNTLCQVLDLPFERLEEAEREVIGHNNRPKGWFTAQDGHDITAPSSPEAQQWNGWGSNLKPSHETWWLVRKPLAEKTIAAQVLATGTGAINVDISRIGTSEIKQQTDIRNGGIWNSEGGDSQRHNGSGTNNPQGRFPSNTLFSHSIWCRAIGERRVRSSGANNPIQVARKDGAMLQSMAIHGAVNYRDEDGCETVQAFECDPSCPVFLLDQQSGVRKSGGGIKSKAGHSIGLLQGEEAYHFKHDGGYCEPSEGGASRFFQTFPPTLDDMVPFIYQSKASRAERSKGCEALPERSVGVGDTRASGDFNQRLHPERGEEYKEVKGQNGHPTVKSISLMKYLISMITPENGIVLDMFAGSGSTGVAAVQCGFHYILIEQELEYIEICRARLAHAHKTAPKPQEDVEYLCSEDCPISQLNQQTKGTRADKPSKSGKGGWRNAYVGGDTPAYMQSTSYADKGGASRFFKTFPPDSLFAGMEEEVL